MADPITKIVGESGQGDVNTLEQELAEKAANIKNTKNVVEKGCKVGFLVVFLGKNKYGTVIGNLAVQWITL